jgi:hypothetical protein
VLNPLPKTSKTADVADAQICDEVIVNHPNRLQLKFKDCFSTATCYFNSVFFSTLTPPPRDHVYVWGGGGGGGVWSPPGAYLL